MLRAIVVGAGGYSGAELVDILLRHPHAEPVALFGSAKRAAAGADAQPQRMDAVFPRFARRCELPLGAFDLAAATGAKPDVAFLATPHEASLTIAPQLLDAGITVIDLSASFRLKNAAAYPAHYGFEHTRPDLLAKAVYGLPELHRAEIAGAQLIAAPGCYPTSAILPLFPLARFQGIRKDRRPIIDSTSGVSGAGRAAEVKNLFCEVSHQPYGVFTHRHAPEIEAYVGSPAFFTPHLGPYDRGIVSTIHVDLPEGWDEQKVRATLHGAYGSERFVRLYPAGRWPSVNAVKHTNYCDIALAVDPATRHLIMVSAIDNLLKGAAGQAVQCMNIRFGIEEASGLILDGGRL